MLKRFFLFMLCVSAFLGVMAQIVDPRLSMQIQVTAGGSAQAEGKHFSWTYGETSIATYYPYLTQGFQQPETQLILVGAGNPLSNLDVRVSPNPTSDRLSIKIVLAGSPEINYFRASIMDVFGRLVMGPQTLSFINECILDCRDLRPGMWLLQLQNPDSGKSVLIKFIKVD
ncbi:MAG TPA: hypothetical protein VFX48_05320 [Saprospiraceae bacterium]|nr:hypothetical protein [Saprospiraceae bacterium]